ncbi:MAG TPA: preprotein translocase subunit SecE [Gemmatimonadaceae bacterium]|nr:preprotein translocase subunit SecE [Gemmatimonadaceae bacterium]
MSTTVVPRRGRFSRFMDGLRQVPTFLGEVRQEMRKVTWPDRTQLRQATIAIIIFVLIIGAVIALMDLALQAILVRGIPSLFGVR